RQRLREVDLVDDHEPVGLGRFFARVEGLFERHQDPEDRERYQNRDDHQDGAQLLGEEILADEHEIVHAASSFSMNCPLSRCSTRSAYRAAAGSCVTMTMVLAKSRLRSWRMDKTSSAVARSRSPVGSSARMSCGSD